MKILIFYCFTIILKTGERALYADYIITVRKDTYVVPGRVAQSVTCLATDASLIADPGVASSIPARSHTFVEISPPFR